MVGIFFWLSIIDAQESVVPHELLFKAFEYKNFYMSKNLKNKNILGLSTIIVSVVGVLTHISKPIMNASNLNSELRDMYCVFEPARYG